MTNPKTLTILMTKRLAAIKHYLTKLRVEIEAARELEQELEQELIKDPEQIEANPDIVKQIEDIERLTKGLEEISR